jgi:serine/threonine protein kinase/CheY-like chemotaxis protein
MLPSSVRRFGPYTILDKLADGGMAEIYIGKLQGYSGFEKLIALKMILPRYSQHPAFAQMLIQEAKLAARLQHFNVVQVLDLGEINGQIYLAMEYVRGRDLAALLSNVYRRKELIPVELSLYIATEFMTGLDYAHRSVTPEGEELGIIHRDISPQNVLISFEGEVKVTDFGIARVLSSKDELKLPGTLHGKFGYMSPEQVRREEIDQRSDIFSAGVVLYEMLTGRRLFRGKTQQDTVDMVLNKPFTPPSDVNPDVNSDLNSICEKALARSQSQRYQTIGALIGDLSRVCNTMKERAVSRDLAVYMRRQFVSDHTQTKGGTEEGGTPVRAPTSPISSSGGRALMGQILLKRGAITENDLEIALAEQRAKGGRLAQILITSGHIGENELLDALAAQTRLPVVSDQRLQDLTAPVELQRLFPRDVALGTQIVPVRINQEKGAAELVLCDPTDERAILEAKIVLGVHNLTLSLCTRTQVRTLIDRWYTDDGRRINWDSPTPFVKADTRAEPTPIVIQCVLIADGDPTVVDPLVELLREEGVQTHTAADGKTAKKIIQDHHPQVALLDAALPKIDGYNLLLEIRSQDPHAAVFITSSRGDDFRQAKAMELGADDFLVKPFRTHVLASKLRRELKKRARNEPEASSTPTPTPVVARGVTGSLKDMNAIDIIQSLEVGQKTAHVTLEWANGSKGYIAVEQGKIRGASTGDLTGDAAFFQLMTPEPGQFRIDYRKSSLPESIEQPNTFLMIEAMRRLDEAVRTGPSTSRTSNGSNTMSGEQMGEPLQRKPGGPGPKPANGETLKQITDDLLVHEQDTEDVPEMRRTPRKRKHESSGEYRIVEQKAQLARVPLVRVKPNAAVRQGVGDAQTSDAGEQPVNQANKP